MIVKRIETFGEGLMASGAKIPLISVGHFAMFMRFYVSAEQALHRADRETYLLILSDPTNY
jgi:hypothetical protein